MLAGSIRKTGYSANEDVEPWTSVKGSSAYFPESTTQHTAKPTIPVSPKSTSQKAILPKGNGPGSIGTLPSFTDRWAAKTEADLRRVMDALRSGDEEVYVSLHRAGRWQFIEPGTPAYKISERGSSVKVRITGGTLRGQEFWINAFDFVPEGWTETLGQPNTVPYDYDF